MLTKHPLYAPFLLTAILTLLACAALTQEVYDGTQHGLPIFGSFNGTNLDSVSLSNGNLHIEIPILSVQQRGRAFTYRFVYDTESWAVSFEPNPDPNGFPKGWWFVDPENGASNFRLVDSLKFRATN